MLTPTGARVRARSLSGLHVLSISESVYTRRHTTAARYGQKLKHETHISECASAYTKAFRAFFMFRLCMVRKIKSCRRSEFLTDFKMYVLKLSIQVGVSNCNTEFYELLNCVDRS